MSSKQLNFFITPEDYQRINSFIHRKEALVLLNEDITSNNKIEIKSGIPSAYVYKIYIFKKEFLDKIKIKTITTNANDIKSFVIDESYLLEFNLGGFFPNDKNALQRARFYYVKSFWNEENILEEKSNDFTLWCNDFIKDFKKHFLKKFSKEKTFLYSDSAIKWIEDNNASEAGGGMYWEKKTNDEKKGFIL